MKMKSLLSPRGSVRPAMTLVEVMISMAVFMTAILGTVGVFMMALRTIEDSRSFTQVVQVLNHEMEAMRTRWWADRPAQGTSPKVDGLFTLGGAPASYPGATRVTSFQPFAIYGAPLRTDGVSAAVLGGPDANDIGFGDSLLAARYRNAAGTAAGYVCERRVTLRLDGCGEKYAEIELGVSWVDRKGLTHKRSLYSVMSEHGINGVLYDPAQIQ